MGDIYHINTPGRHIGRYQDIDLIILEAFESPLALTLVFAAMDRIGFETAANQLLAEPLDVALGFVKNNYLSAGQ
jgi:hypothetical protein